MGKRLRLLDGLLSGTLGEAEQAEALQNEVVAKQFHVDVEQATKRALPSKTVTKENKRGR